MSGASFSRTPRRTLQVEVVLLPKDIVAGQLNHKSAVVFDVLRATTSITAALAAGVGEIRIFADINSAASSAATFTGPRLLCGEVKCLRPEGFDLGNSPRAFESTLHADRTMFLSTTNGTKGIIAAQDAAVTLIGALVNASKTAEQLADLNRDIVLICSGTQGQVSLEDVLGAGAVLDQLVSTEAGVASNDAARIALRLYQAVRSDLKGALTSAFGGQNLAAVGLQSDIEFCAAIDSIPVVGRVHANPLRVCRSA